MPENLQTTPDAFDALRALIEAEEDVKSVIHLRREGERFRYLIETPFETFPKFVIGTTDATNEDVHPEVMCGLLSVAQDAWDQLTAGKEDA